MNMNDYLSTKEAAEELEVIPRRVRALIKGKRLEAVKVAGGWYVLKTSIDNLERDVKPWGLQNRW